MTLFCPFLKCRPQQKNIKAMFLRPWTSSWICQTTKVKKTLSLGALFLSISSLFEITFVNITWWENCLWFPDAFPSHKRSFFTFFPRLSMHFFFFFCFTSCSDSVSPLFYELATGIAFCTAGKRVNRVTEHFLKVTGFTVSLSLSVARQFKMNSIGWVWNYGTLSSWIQFSEFRYK